MFEAIQKLPPDPILGLTGAYESDPNPNKVDLGAGVYKDESGATPIFKCIKEAERRWGQQESTKVYISPPGFADFNTAIQKLVLGADHPALAAGRVRSVMAPGGCGALRVGAELINRCKAGSTIWVSKPTWANHVPLLGSAGLKIAEYPYYDGAAHGVDFDTMQVTLEAATRGDLLLLHGCCHNPTGADLNRKQWDVIVELAARKGLVPFVDLAYQGLGEGLDADAYGLRMLALAVPELLLAYSCSKNFGLYRDRIGALLTVSPTPEQADAGLTHINNIARVIYSMPPAHGGALVKTVLNDPALYAQWQDEVDGMRNRIHMLRALLVDTLKRMNAPRDFEFIKREYGMFSFLGISKEQVQRLRTEFSIYMVDSSRINVAGVSPKNIEYLARAINSVL